MMKMVLISGSGKVRESPKSPVPALERFGGPMAGIVKRYKNENQLHNIDVMILSPGYGLINADEEIGYKEPFGGKRGWYSFDFEIKDIEKIRDTNLLKLKTQFDKKTYDELYVSVGKKLLPLIQGFETVIPKNVKITCAKGRGFGYKLADFKAWIESNRV